ncbi:hypothetical protein BC567DRAFT_268633 [Phyllosticta citribraziliensis]
MQLSTATLLIFLELALTIVSTALPNQYCCFSEESEASKRGPCSPYQFDRHRDVVNTFLAGSDCILVYAEQYNCDKDLTGSPRRELGDCFLQCIPVQQSGPCPEFSASTGIIVKLRATKSIMLRRDLIDMNRPALPSVFWRIDSFDVIILRPRGRFNAARFSSTAIVDSLWQANFGASKDEAESWGPKA